MAFTIKVPPGQLGVFLKRQAKKFGDNVERGVRLGAERGRKLLRDKTPVYDGLMRAAWKVSAIPQGKGTLLSNDAPYAGVIEGGARPHGVSPEGKALIREWVRKKLTIVDGGKIGPAMKGAGAGYGIPKNNIGPWAHKQQKARPLTKLESGYGQEAEQIDAIVEAICHKIAMKGQPGKWIVRDNLGTLKRYVMDEIAGLMAKR